MTTNKRQTTKAAAANSGIITGFNKGHQTTKRARPVSTKARLGLPKPKLRAVKALIDDLCGLTPLQKRVQELLRVGKEKRALKFCNKRLGNIKAAKKMRAKMEDAIRNATTKKK